MTSGWSCRCLDLEEAASGADVVRGGVGRCTVGGVAQLGSCVLRAAGVGLLLGLVGVATSLQRYQPRYLVLPLCNDIVSLAHRISVVHKQKRWFFLRVYLVNLTLCLGCSRTSVKRFTGRNMDVLSV